MSVLAESRAARPSQPGPGAESPSASSLQQLKAEKRALVREYAGGDNREGFREVLVTVVPLAICCWIAGWGLHVSLWITVAATLAISLFMARVFTLMHDCGHGSLFATPRLNRVVGFFFGVASGMPQYVWSNHHHYHHQTNGNWDRYRGALTTLTIPEFEALSGFRQWVYLTVRHPALLPLGGFIYLLFNPRFNWIRGTLALVAHVLRGKIARPSLSFREHAATFQTRLWASPREYWHQTGNNVVLLSLWVLFSWAIGIVPFFAIYLTSVSLAGGAGIALFTVQHNFEHSYASDGAHWDYETGAIAGSSFLILPRWLNWFTANIAYHHVHHLSAKIPNYRLIECHDQHRELFTDVTRVNLFQIPQALKYILWDTRTQRIISVAEYNRQQTTQSAMAS